MVKTTPLTFETQLFLAMIFNFAADVIVSFNGASVFGAATTPFLQLQQRIFDSSFFSRAALVPSLVCNHESGVTGNDRS